MPGPGTLIKTAATAGGNAATAGGSAATAGGSAATAGTSAATALVAPAVLPQRKRAPSVAADGDERPVNAPRPDEIIPTAARR
jgi:hypothetical protein